MVMYTIGKQFHFSASHQLVHLPDGHPCKRLHGHNYTVELILCSHALDRRGFVLDYNEMAPFAKHIYETLDHRHLNDRMEMPTAERIAEYLWDVAAELYRPENILITVRVHETPSTFAEYAQP